jgi:hypothetical protein
MMMMTRYVISKSKTGSGNGHMQLMNKVLKKETCPSASL